jgi:diaminohydroxyphosphoribosylaminopyrimidine deaminase/5-amino-6-(5-phosphoribosylamino)uracil reductase
VDAILDAGIANVVCARQDPFEPAAGGATRLRGAGVGVDFTDASDAATRLTDPFIKRVRTGLPWVIAKWAQTIDARVATRTGQSKWISSAASRKRVHRLRGRVDAILTGIGTVTTDDPELTARDVTRVRRVARRVIVDPDLRIPVASRLVRTIERAPITVICTPDAANADARHEERRRLEAEGVQILALEPGADGRIDPGAILRLLVRVYDATNVLVEAGPRLIGAMHDESLIDELRVYIAPMLLGDAEALPPVSSRPKPHLLDGERFTLARIKRLGDDIEIRYRRPD